METYGKMPISRQQANLSLQAQHTVPTSIGNPTMPAMIGIQDQLDYPFENMWEPLDPPFMSPPQMPQQMNPSTDILEGHTFQKDMQQFKDWKKANPLSAEHKKMYLKKNRVYESVADGRIGSLYYGAGNQMVGNEIGLRDAPQQTLKKDNSLTPPDEEVVERAPGVPQATGAPHYGGRIRLLHSQGPKVSRVRPVERFVVTEQGRKPINPNKLTQTNGGKMREWFYKPNGRYVSRHPSRGFVEKTKSINRLKAKDFTKLLRATMFAEELAKGTFNQKGCSLTSSVYRANQFLYAYLHSHPRLTNIPLNMEEPKEWVFRPNFLYAPRGSLEQMLDSRLQRDIKSK